MFGYLECSAFLATSRCPLSLLSIFPVEMDLFITPELSALNISKNVTIVQLKSVNVRFFNYKSV